MGQWMGILARKSKKGTTASRKNGV